MSTTYNLINW